jgi:hypothetical protein
MAVQRDGSGKQVIEILRRSSGFGRESLFVVLIERV